MPYVQSRGNQHWHSHGCSSIPHQIWCLVNTLNSISNINGWFGLYDMLTGSLLYFDVRYWPCISRYYLGGNGPVSTSLQWHTLWYSSNKKCHCRLFLFTDERQVRDSEDRLWHGFLTLSKPHLKRAAWWCWQHFRAITFLFSTCAKVIRQDNEVLASNDSLEHCSISYVKPTDSGYCLYWRACVSFWKLKFFCVCSRKELG